jgi:CBS domain-containing protein
VIDVAVRDVMQQDPITVAPALTLAALVDLFVKERLAAVPVVDENGKVLGMVTEGDLILQEVEGDFELPHFVPFLDGAIFLQSSDRWDRQMRKAFAATAADIMTRDVRTVTPDSSIHEAAKKMANHDVSRLPVVDDGRLLGLISRSDIVRALAKYEFRAG